MSDDMQSLEKQLAAIQQQRRETFLAAYRGLAAEHGCDLAAVPYIDDDGRIRARIIVVEARAQP